MDAGSEVSACAALLEAHADDMEASARRIGASASATRWESPAATAALRQVEAVTARLRGCAGQLREAAEAVRRHGMAVGSALAALRTMSAEVDDLAGRGVVSVRGLLASGRATIPSSSEEVRP